MISVAREFWRRPRESIPKSICSVQTMLG